METPVTHHATAAHVRAHSLRVYAVSSLGPATVRRRPDLGDPAALPHHPAAPARGEGLWCLLFEPPLFVVVVGVAVHPVRGTAVVADLEAGGCRRRAEMIHWVFGAVILLSGCSARRGAGRPGGVAGTALARIPLAEVAFVLGVLLWPVMAFFTNSAIHMYAHGSWAQVLMLAGAAELGARARAAHSRSWRLATPLAFAISGTAFLVHEQNAVVLRAVGVPAPPARLDVLLGALLPLALVWRPRSALLQSASRS